MRYVLRRNGEFVAQSDSVTDLIDGAWGMVRDKHGSTWTMTDTKKGVKWPVWSVRYDWATRGIELSAV